MANLAEDMAALEGKAKKGDVMAGIAVILEILAAGSVGYLALKAILLSLLMVAPWTAPFITPAVMASIMGAVIKAYGELPSHKRKVVATAIKWLTGGITLG